MLRISSQQFFSSAENLMEIGNSKFELTFKAKLKLKLKLRSNNEYCRTGCLNFRLKFKQATGNVKA